MNMNGITCICLGVKDMERSVSFYRDELGFRADCVSWGIARHE